MSASPELFQLDDVRFRMGHPMDVARLEYWTLQAFSQGVFIGSLQRQGLVQRTAEEVKEMIGGEDFAATHRKPSVLNERPKAPQQLFGRPHMVIAERDSSIIGFGYAVNATSGSTTERVYKMLAQRSKRWAWIREIVTDPNAPTGLGTMIGALLLNKFNDQQPTSAYTWAENPLGARFVKSMGYRRPIVDGHEEPPRTRYPFGTDGAPVELIRWTGMVGAVKAHILEKPGAKEAFEQARKNTVEL